MANLFDVANAPEGEPKEIVAGDFVQWKRSDLVDDYPVADYSAELVARISGDTNEIKISATENADYYLFSANTVTTAGYAAGTYSWQLEITQTSSSNTIVVDSGTFQVAANLDAAGVDPRSHASIMLTKIESILAGKADSDVSNYSINGRSLTKFSFEELMTVREAYKSEVTREQNKELAKNGEKTSQTILVRF